MASYKEEDLVLAKISGYKPWPSIICPESKLPPNILAKKPHNAKKYPVYFLADGTFSWCSDAQLTPFTVEHYEKVKSALKGVHKKSFEVALTHPSTDEVVPVFAEPEPEPEVDPQQTDSKKRKATTNAKKGKTGKKAKAKPKPRAKPEPEPEPESESEPEDEDEEEEQEIKQPFIPQLDSKALATTLSSNQLQIEKFRVELQKILFRDLEKPKLKPNWLEKLSQLGEDGDNFVNFKKNKIFKLCGHILSRPDLDQVIDAGSISKLRQFLAKYDQYPVEVDANWDSEFDYIKKEQEPTVTPATTEPITSS